MSTFSSYVWLFCAVVMTLSVISKNFPTAHAGENLDWRFCQIEFADKTEKMKMVTDCATKHKFPLKLNQSLDGIKEEVKLIKEKNFDDGCFSKCLYEQTHILGKDGKVDTSKFADLFKNSNASGDLLKEIKTMFETCVAETEAKFKDEKEVPCKMYTMVGICVFSKAVDNKKQLEEICKK